MKNPYSFEYNAILEDLEDESLEVSKALQLQYRLCELKMLMKEHQDKLLKDRKEIFRKRAVPDHKRVRESELSDLRAFKHMLENREICKQYKASTLTKWSHDLNKGKLPTNFVKYLKANGYRIEQQRKWSKPNGRKNGK
jgi:hypothetical protein